MALLLGLLAFFTSYVHPFARTAVLVGEAPANHRESHASIDQTVGAILLQTSILSGAILLLVRRWGWRWPVGSLTLLLLLNLAPVTLMFDRLLAIEPLALIIAALLAGISADALMHLLRPSLERPRATRIFAGMLPAMLYAYYLATVALSGGIWWSPHLISGAVTLAAIAGWLMSYLIFPPAYDA